MSCAAKASGARSFAVHAQLVWNYWAYTKWLYTVPGFDHLKWFETPPLGFLGFPPFALECYVLVNLLNALRRGRGWEHPRGRGASRAAAVALALVALVFDVVVYAGIDRWTAASTAPEMAGLEDVPKDLLPRLERVGLGTPPAFLQAVAHTGIDGVAEEAGGTRPEVLQAYSLARLTDLKGLGALNANALWGLGVQSVEDLARSNPEDLLPRWRAAAARAPSEAQVRLWIRAARREVEATSRSRQGTTRSHMRPISRFAEVRTSTDQRPTGLLPNPVFQEKMR